MTKFLKNVGIDLVNPIIDMSHENNKKRTDLKFITINYHILQSWTFPTNKVIGPSNWFPTTHTVQIIQFHPSQ